jgi:hypothetical protein
VVGVLITTDKTPGVTQCLTFLEGATATVYAPSPTLTGPLVADRLHVTTKDDYVSQSIVATSTIADHNGALHIPIVAYGADFDPQYSLYSSLFPGQAAVTTCRTVEGVGPQYGGWGSSVWSTYSPTSYVGGTSSPSTAQRPTVNPNPTSSSATASRSTSTVSEASHRREHTRSAGILYFGVLFWCFGVI